MDRITRLEQEMEFIREHIDPIPAHFSMEDIVITFFGAFLIGLTFMFKGMLIEIGVNLPWANVAYIMTSTFFILTAEIYFIGYKRVPDKTKRRFGQFYIKRLVTTYGIALMVSFYLCFIFGIMYFAGSLENMTKLVLVLSMPCSIGAAISQMLRKL